MKGHVRRSLRASVWDGVLAAITGSATDQFLTPFAIALQAGANQIACLTSLPNLIGIAGQLQSGFWRSRQRARKKAMVVAIGLQTVCVFAWAFIPWFPAAWRVSVLIALEVVFTAAGAFATPLWGSLMCEYLPLSRRSGYFGWRSRLLGGVTIVATGIGGLVLQQYGRLRLAGFVWLFAAAGLVRLTSLRFLNQMHEPVDVPQEAPSYRTCFHAHRPFRNFILTCGLMNFCVALSGPFLSLYMLRSLKLSYAWYTLMIMASQVTMYWMMGRWGRNADRAGNLKIVQITARFLPLTALLWIFSRNLAYLVGVQLFTGLVWAGYNLCMGNFVYDSVPNRQRVHATALLNTVNGLATFAGATAGGALLTWLPPLHGEPYYALLLIGASGRALVGWGLFPRLREVRRVPRTRSKDLVYDVLGLPPLDPEPAEKSA